MFNAIAQQASAYQGGFYQPGIMNVRDLAAPPGEGLIIIDYNFWINSNGYRDINGDRRSGITIPNPEGGENIIVNLDTEIKAYVNAPVIFYVTKFKILGARYSVSAAPTIIGANVRVDIQPDDSENVHAVGNTGGFGDMLLMPVDLAWSFDKKVDVSLMYSMYLPIGRFELGADDNIGKGYLTHQIQAPTYLYLMEKATALFVMPTLEMNGQIRDTDVSPGSRFTVEYGFSQYLTSWLEIEVINGHNWQITDDKGDDVWWKDTDLYERDSNNTFGAGVGVWPLAGKLNLRAKYAFDYGSKNRFKNTFFSFSAIFIPNLFTGKNRTSENPEG
jgi:hypothetical protein